MTRRRVASLDAPSNLGLRPPPYGAVPGCYKAPWVLRDHGLFTDVDERYAGAVVPPPYVLEWTPGDGARNGAAVAAYSRSLADRLGPLLDEDDLLLVLGGDCSVLIGVGLALRRRGRFGLVFMDGHADFRHLGNAPRLEAAAGEDLAILTGRGDPRLIDLDGLGPSIHPDDAAIVGVRDSADDLEEVRALGFDVWTVNRLRRFGITRALEDVAARVTRTGLDGFWIHVDVDVLDASVMPAVDSPEPDGVTFEELSHVLTDLLARPEVVGLDLCIYDPDLDPTGSHGAALARSVNTVLRG